MIRTITIPHPRIKLCRLNCSISNLGNCYSLQSRHQSIMPRRIKICRGMTCLSTSQFLKLEVCDTCPSDHYRREETALLSIGKPADFSFRRMKTIDVEKFLKDIGLEGARYTRVAGVPERGAEKKKFLTRSIWLNNNKLTNTKNVDQLAHSVLEYPEELGWIDFSFNYITEIDECILKFNKLKILYFHGNCISDLDEVFKLRPLMELRSVTFHGNPIANHPRYRSYVVSVLPQIANLDFTPVVRNEKMQPPPLEVVKKFKEIEKAKGNQ